MRGIYLSRRNVVPAIIGLPVVFLSVTAASQGDEPNDDQARPTIHIDFAKAGGKALSRFRLGDMLEFKVEFENHSKRAVEILGLEAERDIPMHRAVGWYCFYAIAADGHAIPLLQRSYFSASAHVCDHWLCLPNGGFVEMPGYAVLHDSFRDLQKPDVETNAFMGSGFEQRSRLTPGTYKIEFRCDRRLYEGSFRGLEAKPRQEKFEEWLKLGPHLDTRMLQPDERDAFWKKYAEKFPYKPPRLSPEEKERLEKEQGSYITSPAEVEVATLRIPSGDRGIVTSNQLEIEILPDKEGVVREDRYE